MWDDDIVLRVLRRPDSEHPERGVGKARHLLAAGATLLILVLATAAVAGGEAVQDQDLIVSLNGRITPHALPRDELAPVTVHVSGKIKTINGAPPQPLRKVSIALNRQGKFDTDGLPTCTSGVLESTTTAQARSICGPALVGSGRFEANVSFPSIATFPAEGTLLAFNGKVKGRPGILLHIYGAVPVQHTFVLPMTITHRRTGTFGTVASIEIPRLAAGLGYVTNLDFAIGRRFRYQGKMHSLLSARCAAPDGIPGAIFTFAKATFTFANGQTLSPSLVRDCKVRD